jgi:hypothetical protein
MPLLVAPKTSGLFDWASVFPSAVVETECHSKPSNQTKANDESGCTHRQRQVDTLSGFRMRIHRKRLPPESFLYLRMDRVI